MTMRNTIKHNVMATLVAGCAVAVLLVTPLQAAPKAGDTKGSWTLDVDCTTPQAIMIKVPGQKAPELFWYFLYTVTNRTGADRMFTPEIILYTNTGQIIQAGKGINPLAYRTIRKIHKDSLLRDNLGVMGKLLQGADNAMSGMVVFRNFDPRASSFDIFFGGLSGDNALVKLPSPIMVSTISPSGKIKTVKKTSVILSKTLRIICRLGAEARDRADAKVRLVEKDWIMR